ncbi:hypothetical protein D3C85_1672800 [compost metagenome]
MASHENPFEVEARAPGGLLSMTNSWVVPRVMVAQAGRLTLKPASVRACTASRAWRLEIMTIPKRIRSSPPG